MLLAGASLAFAVWPTRFLAVSRWWDRLHIGSSVNVSNRVLTGVHIGLLAALLIGAAAPPALATTLRGQVEAKYTLAGKALQPELETTWEQAAYKEIRDQFSRVNRTSPIVKPLTAIVSEIHHVSSPPPGSDTATPAERDLAERDLADRIGQLQGSTLKLAEPKSIPAEFKAPIRDAGDLQQRLRQLDTEQRRAHLAKPQDNTAKLQADRFAESAEFAAKALAPIIASIIPIPVDKVEAILREYVSSVVESCLNVVFSAWVQHHMPTTPPKTITPATVDRMVIPNPTHLEAAAAKQEAAAAKQEVAANRESRASAVSSFSHLRPPSTSPATSSDANLARLASPGKSPAVATVDLVNETRNIQEEKIPLEP